MLVSGLQVARSAMDLRSGASEANAPCFPAVSPRYHTRVGQHTPEFPVVLFQWVSARATGRVGS